MNPNKKTARIQISGMKTKVQIGCFILGMIFLNTSIFAQADEWKTAKLDDGKITVQYNISTRIDENGEEVQLIEDTTTTADSLSIQNCILVMKDVSKHKEFTDDQISEKVKTISDSEWVVYYYTDNPWPIANSDCVSRMTFFEDTTKKTAVFKFTAAPFEYKEVDVERMTYYDVMYSFKDLGNGKVEITMTGKTTPPVKVPLWIIRLAFPEAPASALRKFVKLAKDINK
jgi:hypothetical protein